MHSPQLSSITLDSDTMWTKARLVVLQLDNVSMLR
jgi:hypothetical protein